MTDEKKKPEEDEVSDEQLEGVAGGGIAGPGSGGEVPVTWDLITRLPSRLDQKPDSTSSLPTAMLDVGFIKKDT